jgi:dephospho-CoA kinase
MSVPIVKHRPLIIGLTGGLASGKSTVANYLKKEGYDVIDADRIVYDLYQHDQDMQQAIKDVFGFSVYAQKDKSKLARIIFSDEEKRRQLNAIIHPRVFAQIEDYKEKHAHAEVIIIDMPLLIEVGYDKRCDVTILVYVKRRTQIRRLMKRDGLSEEEAIRRIATQMSLDKKRHYADYVLDNERSKEELYHQIDYVMKGISGP